jgi:glycosyltransferase involved in cell wall biosynthesis
VLKVVSIVLNNFKNDSRVLKTNISLQNNGYDVQVVAILEDGVKEFEKVQNIPIHRMKLVSKNWSKNKVVQLFKYFEFLYRTVKKYKESDILHCNDLNALPIGVIIKKFFNKNTKIVYDAHEHESYRAGYSKTMQVLSRWFEGKLIKYADKVITVSYSIADDYEKMYNIPKPALILNTPLYKEIVKQDIFREKFNIPTDDIIFLYQGGLSRNRGILEFARFITDRKNISYIIMGYGELEKDIKLFAKNSKNVYFHEAVSPKVLLDYTGSADIGICIEEPICKSWEFALPNKLFEYMICNLPIIVGGLSEMMSFVKNNDIGFVIKDIYKLNEFDKQLDSIIKTYKTKIPNIREKAKIFNWQEQEKVFIQLYEDLDSVK